MSEKTTILLPTRVALAQRQTETDSPILVRFKVPEKTLFALKGLVPHNRMSKAALKRQNKQRADEGNLMQIDPFDYARKNSAGILVADTGSEMLFNKENLAKGSKFNMRSLVEDFKKMGYELMEVYSTQKTTDLKPTLVFEFNKPTAGDIVEKYPSIVEETFHQLITSSWDYVHIWNNPDDVITINASGKSENKKCCQLKVERMYVEEEREWADQVLPKGIYFIEYPAGTF